MAPAAVGRLIGACESLASIKQFGPGGILQGRSARRESAFVPLPVRRALDSTAGSVVIHVAAAIGSSCIILGRSRRSQQIVGAALLFASKALGEYRNPYGGDGADQMSDVISGYRLVTAVVSDKAVGDDLFLRAVNAQVTVSYVASGLAKLISSTWRSGQAVDMVLRTKLYGSSRLAEFIRQRPALGRLVSWTTIAWETGYPMIYRLPPGPASGALALIKFFHLGIAVTMGLPRFFWAFSSSHAAVRYVLSRRRIG
jgi:hypothetical protein